MTRPSYMSFVGRALHVILTAVIVMIAIPVSQLRTISVLVECCCPDPDNCHCPDDGKAVPGQATMKSCHKSSEIVAGAPTTDFRAPAATLHEPPRRIVAAQFSLSSPHRPPNLPRPPGPS